MENILSYFSWRIAIVDLKTTMLVNGDFWLNGKDCQISECAIYTRCSLIWKTSIVKDLCGSGYFAQLSWEIAEITSGSDSCCGHMGFSVL